VNSLYWKRQLGKICSQFKDVHMPRKVILTYHAVGGGPWAISNNNFKEQVQWLVAHNKVVTLDTILTDKYVTDDILVAITFDDGYACLHDIVAPILLEYNVSATVYLNTGWISADLRTRKASRPDFGHYPGESFLTWDEVNTLYQLGWNIGSHGVDHIDLTKQPESIVRKELSRSKNDIEEKLRTPCRDFAYTWGKYNTFLENKVMKAGYRSAVSTLHSPFFSVENFFAIPRLNIASEYKLDDVIAVVAGHWDFIKAIQNGRKLFCLSG